MTQSYYDVFINDDVIPNSFYKYDPAFNIAGFLKSKNSFLATYSINGISFSSYLNDACKTLNQNPKIHLVNLQKEQSIINMTTEPPTRVMNRALGYGMEDDGDKPAYYGFQKQIDSAIAWYSSHYSKFNVASPGSILVDSSDRFGVPGFKIAPKNTMTYLNYYYTPWTGTPTSIFSTGFWFDETLKQIMLDISSLRGRLGNMIPGTMDPDVNPFFVDVDNKVITTEDRYNIYINYINSTHDGPINNPVEPVVAEVLKVYRQKPWGTHGVYLFWDIWKTFFPDDLKQSNHIEVV
jgi:hypothetical protein